MDYLYSVWVQYKTESEHEMYKIFIDRFPVGGFDDIRALDCSGELDRLVLGD